MSRRALAILGAVAAILAVVVLVDLAWRGGRAPGEGETERLLPGLDPEAVTRLQIRDVSPGVARDVTIERQGDAFFITAPRPVAADDDVVRELLADLAFAPIRRRMPGAALPDPRFTITVDGRTVTVGKEDPALSRVWVAVDGQVALIDTYLGRAFDRGLDDLRDRAPFRPTGRETRLVVGPVVLEGRPFCVKVFAGCVRADAERVEGFIERLADLRISRFVDRTGEPRLTIALGETGLTVMGDCPGGEHLVQARVGTGCVELPDLTGAVTPGWWMDRALITLQPQRVHRVELPGLVLERQGGEWKDVASSSVRAWLDALADARATSFATFAESRGRPVASVTLTADAGSETLHLLAGDLVRRGDEPLALHVPPEVARLFRAGAADFRDRTVLEYEPWSLEAVEAAGEGKLDVETIRHGAARLVADRILETRDLTPVRTLVFTVAPPGKTTRILLELGARLPDRTCPARRPPEPTVYALAPADCDLLLP